MIICNLDSHKGEMQLPHCKRGDARKRGKILVIEKNSKGNVGAPKEDQRV